MVLAYDRKPTIRTFPGGRGVDMHRPEPAFPWGLRIPRFSRSSALPDTADPPTSISGVVVSGTSANRAKYQHAIALQPPTHMPLCEPDGVVSRETARLGLVVIGSTTRQCRVRVNECSALGLGRSR
jgi:hypothetical protein